MDALKDKIKELNECSKQFKKLAQDIENMRSDYHAFFISNNLHLEDLDQTSLLHCILREEQIHKIYKVLKDTNINFVNSQVNYDSNDEGASIRFVSWHFDEEQGIEDDEESTEDFDDLRYKLNDNIAGDFFDEERIDITHIRALYENKNIIKHLKIEEKTKTKVSKV